MSRADEPETSADLVADGGPGPERPADPPAVLAVHAADVAPASGFAKPARSVVRLEATLGVEGDRHGDRPLRQVHLVDAARYGLLRGGGHDVGPGYLGENVTTSGVDLLSLKTGAVLRLGAAARVRVTGLRHPRHEDPATDPVGLSLDADGVPVGRVGVFAVVETPGEVRAGDPVVVEDAGDGGPLRPL